MGPVIEVILDGRPMPANVAEALVRIDAKPTIRTPVDPPTGGSEVRIIVAPPGATSGSDFLQTLSDTCQSRPCPTLVVTDNPAPPSCQPGIGRPPVSFVNGISVEEMVGRLSAMCAFSESLRQYEDELTLLRSLESQAAEKARYLNTQLQSARRIQQDLLPDASTVVSDRFAINTLYRPADTVSGDIYEIAALPAQQIGIALIDATGHGVGAALLTAYVQGSLRREGVQGLTGSVLQPEQILSRLNNELVRAQLSDCQFVTGLFAAYDPATDTLHWARGASPYPVLLKNGQSPQQLKTLGPLIGAFPDQRFDQSSLRLDPGDCLLFYTDGLEALLIHEAGSRIADNITQTDWYKSLRGNRLLGHLDAIHHRLNYTPPDAWPRDDITVVALHRTA